LLHRTGPTLTDAETFVPHPALNVGLVVDVAIPIYVPHS